MIILRSYQDFSRAFLEAIQNGSLEEFAVMLNEILYRNYRVYFAWLFLARANERMGNIEKAKNCYKELLTFDNLRPITLQEIEAFCRTNNIRSLLTDRKEVEHRDKEATNSANNGVNIDATDVPIQVDRKEERHEDKSSPSVNSLAQLMREASKHALDGELNKSLEILDRLYTAGFRTADFICQYCGLLHRMGDTDKAIKTVETFFLENNNSKGKTFSNLLLIKAQLYSAKEQYDKAIEAYQDLIDVEGRDSAKASHFNMLARIYAKLGNLDEAMLFAKRVLSLNPRDSLIKNFISYLESSKKLYDSEEFKIDGKEEKIETISQMLQIDIEEYEYRDKEIISRGGIASQQDAQRILHNATRQRQKDALEMVETYYLYLEAAKAFNDLPVGSYNVSDYYTALAQYATLRGNIIFNEFSKTINESNRNLSALRSYKDSACSYYLEGINLQYHIDDALILLPLSNYLKIQVQYELARKGQSIPSEISSGDFNTVFQFCILSKDKEIEHLPYKSIIACGAANISLWNKLARVSGGTGSFFGKIHTVEQRKIIYDKIMEIENEEFDSSLLPGEFFRKVIENRRQKTTSLRSALYALQKIDLSPRTIRDVMYQWQTIVPYQGLFSESDVEISNAIKEILNHLEPYLFRSPEERTNILYKVRTSVEEHIKFIQENTTYWGRVGFYRLFKKWRSDINKIEKERLKDTLPKLRVLIDPPLLQTEGDKIVINLLLKNEGLATAEGTNVRYVAHELNNRKVIIDKSFLLNKEIGVKQQISQKIRLSEETLGDHEAISFLVEVYPIFEHKELDPQKFWFTLELESGNPLKFQDIIWNEVGIPPKPLFKGREDIMSLLMRHFKTSDRNKTYILYGLTRTGKSSILKYLGEKLDFAEAVIGNRSCKFVSFYWELQKAASQSNAQDMWAFLLLDGIMQKLAALATENKIDQGCVPKLKNLDKVRFVDWQRIIAHLNANNLYPIFLVDEFSYYKNLADSRRIDASFLAAIRSFSIDGNASFVFAGTYDLKELIKDPVYGITGQLVNTIEMQISQIDDRDSRELIGVLGNKLMFTEEAIQHILFLTNKIPYFIQILCKYCGHYAVETGKKFIGYPEVEYVTSLLAGEQKAPANTKIVNPLPPGTFMNNQYSPIDLKPIGALFSTICHLNRGKINPRGLGYGELQEIWGKKKIPGFMPKLAESIDYLKTKGIIVEGKDEGLPIYRIGVDLFRRWWATHHTDYELEIDSLKGD